LKYTLTSLLLFVALLLSGCGEKNTPTEEKATPVTNIPPPPPRKEVKTLQIDDLGKFLMEEGQKYPEQLVTIKTEFGDIQVKLFEDTPLHRANFVMNVHRKLYDNTVFYRVVKGFMIQGGNSDNDATQERRKVLPPYYIPSEIKSNHYHKKGALAMAMSYTDNPDRKSSQYSFYIVQGGPLTSGELDAVEREYEIKIPAARRRVYSTLGGTPHLDGIHTVFGEVVTGMDVVEKIANTKVDGGDWPINDVFMHMEVVK